MPLEALVRGTPGFDLAAKLLDEEGLPTDDLSGRDIDLFADVEGGSIKGVVGLQDLGEVALLRSLAVGKSYRGSGLGERYTAFAEKEAARRGFTHLYLLTDTAKGFFSKRGYASLSRVEAPASVQETPQFSSLCPDTAQLMCRSL